jgi:hypothetical protein
MQLSELILTYERHPDLFVEDLLGVTPQDWQREVMSAVAKGAPEVQHPLGPRCREILLCILVDDLVLLTRYPVKIVVTAPTASQLFDALFAECKDGSRNSPLRSNLLEMKSDRIELGSSPPRHSSVQEPQDPNPQNPWQESMQTMCCWS